VARGFESASQAHGTAQILVNCAGITPLGVVASDDGVPHAVNVLRKVIEINLIGSFICLSRFAARLIALDTSEEERGVAINTASIAAFEAQSGPVAYAASKGGSCP
jgi:NAD(P)-dependent dehydrogenase (short-subunit alcohol dehydrogenase family)